MLDVAESLSLLLHVFFVLLLALVLLLTSLLAAIFTRCKQLFAILLESNLPTADLIWKLPEHPTLAHNILLA